MIRLAGIDFDLGAMPHTGEECCASSAIEAHGRAVLRPLIEEAIEAGVCPTGWAVNMGLMMLAHIRPSGDSGVRLDVEKKRARRLADFYDLVVKELRRMGA
jgi:hypothetical protein